MSVDEKIAIANFAFDGPALDDLAFKKDDVLVIINDTDGDWWQAKIQGTTTIGYIPSNYVRSVDGTDKDLGAQDWYHSSISRDASENVLRTLDPGAFIIRLTGKAEQPYCLSLKCPDEIKHFRIGLSDGYYHLLGGKQAFRTITELIDDEDSGLPIKLNFSADTRANKADPDTNFKRDVKELKVKTKLLSKDASNDTLKAEIISLAFEIGDAYYRGQRGAEVDIGKAVESFEVSAGLGDMRSAYNVGMILSTPADRGGKQCDVPRAIKWLKMCANGGDVNGMVVLAQVYLRGSTKDTGGVIEKDPVVADEWLRKAKAVGLDNALDSSVVDQTAALVHGDIAALDREDTEKIEAQQAGVQTEVIAIIEGTEAAKAEMHAYLSGAHKTLIDGGNVDELFGKARSIASKAVKELQTATAKSSKKYQLGKQRWRYMKIALTKMLIETNVQPFCSDAIRIASEAAAADKKSKKVAKRLSVKKSRVLPSSTEPASAAEEVEVAYISELFSRANWSSAEITAKMRDLETTFNEARHAIDLRLPVEDFPLPLLPEKYPLRNESRMNLNTFMKAGPVKSPGRSFEKDKADYLYNPQYTERPAARYILDMLRCVK